MLRAPGSPGRTQDETRTDIEGQNQTTPDIEVHRYGAYRSWIESSDSGEISLSDFATWFVIETENDLRPGIE